MEGKRKSMIIEFLYLFSSIVLLILLLVMVYYSINYWNDNVKMIVELDAKMFSIGLLISIITISLQWIEGRIKAIDRSVRLIIKHYRRKNGKRS